VPSMKPWNGWTLPILPPGWAESALSWGFRSQGARNDRTIPFVVQSGGAQRRNSGRPCSGTERKGAFITEVLTTTKARAGTRPQAMLSVLIVSLILAIIAGLLLTVGRINLPWS
jgi:hypothetical protein